MAQNINRRPKGLQSLLDSKNLGVNPSVLSETVAPTIDLSDLFYVDIPLQQADTSLTYNVFNDLLTPKANIVVPLGETWAIRSWGYYAAVVTASPTLKFQMSQLVVTNTGGNFVVALPGSEQPTEAVGIGQARSFGYTFERPFVVTGGNELALMSVRADGSATCLVTHSVAYYPLST